MPELLRLSNLIPLREATFAEGIRSEVEDLLERCKRQEGYETQPKLEGQDLVWEIYPTNDVSRPVATFKQASDIHQTKRFVLQKLVGGTLVSATVSERSGGKITTHVTIGEGSKPWTSLTYKQKNHCRKTA